MPSPTACAPLFARDLRKRVTQLTEPAVDAPVVDLRPDFEAESARKECALAELQVDLLAVLFLEKRRKARPLLFIGRYGGV